MTLSADALYNAAPTIATTSANMVNTGNMTDLGVTQQKYLDIITPGRETSSGTQVLTLTTTGQLSLWDYDSFPYSSPLWTGSGWNTYNKVVAVGAQGHVLGTSKTFTTKG